MAWSVTSRGTFDQGGTSDDWVSGSFTPAANSLLIVILHQTSGEVVTGISGHDDGSSWVEVYYGSNIPQLNRETEVWACFTGSSPSAGTVTVSHGYVYKTGGVLFEISESVNGVDISGTVANAFGTFDVDVGYDLRTPQCTLASFADSNNLTLASHVVSGGAPSSAYEVGYTAIVNNASTYRYISAAYIASEDNTVDGTLDSYVTSAFLAVEVKQGAGAASVSINVSDSITATQTLD